MDSSRWERIKRVFDEASALEKSEREAFLNEACAGDVDLRAEVEGLLESSDGGGAFDRLAGAMKSLLSAGAESVAITERHVGPYGIVEEIGRGGMGSVYLAKREDVGLEVALKLVRGGLASPENIRRFLVERRILARLEHPNIARLLDAGVTGDGSPYLVMELVSGQPITDYCDQRRLGVVERLQLFRQVCDAVHYAHSNMVVHRDLKPGNIFVEEGGRVKLLDFGIAKLLESDNPDAEATLTGMLVMTPYYASPEQARGEPVTSASDGYSLGVILYELLAGVRPYELQGRTLGEIERAISEADPIRPSVAVAQGGSGILQSSDPSVPEEIARRRGTVPAILAERLKGDLDSIVLKALEKDPRQRYASVDSLWHDLDRHLNSRPIEARPHTVGYRLRRFARRNRPAVAAGALVLASLVAGLAIALWQAREARHERDRAEVELAKSQEVTDFLLGLFEASDPRHAQGTEITARELLETGVQRIEELSDQPTVQAVMSDLVGRVYRNLGDYDKALPLLTSAVELQRKAQPRGNPELARSLNSLGTLYLKQGMYQEAVAALREAVEIRKGLYGETHVDVANGLNDLAVAYRQMGSHKEAEAMYRQALEIYRRSLGDRDPKVATTLSNLAVALRSAGNYEEAESLYREALQIHETETTPDDPARAAIMHNLGTLLYVKGNYPEAESNLRGAIEIRKRVLGEKHPDLASTMEILGLLLRKTERDAESETLLRRALEIRREALGEVHPDVAASLNALGLVEREKGNYEESERYYRAALEIRRKLYGPRHAVVATALNNLAQLLRAKGDLDGAEALFRQAVQMYSETLGGEHPYVAAGMANLASVLRTKRDFAEAGRFARQALTLQRKVLGEGHPALADSLEELGRVLVESGHAEEGLPLLEEAVQSFSERLPADHRRIVSLQIARAGALSELGRFEESERILLECHTSLGDLEGKEREREAVAKGLVDLYTKWGDEEKAELWQDRAGSSK